MGIFLHHEVDKIKKNVLLLGTLVEESVKRAIYSIESNTESMAQKVIQDDDAIDKMEIEIEEECLKVLALYQPVAIDLRYIVVILKINSELERIGDLAVNIAERALALSENKKWEIPFDFKAMSVIVCDMLKKSLDALIRYDSTLATEVLHIDDEVDKYHRETYAKVKSVIRAEPESLDAMIHYMTISKHLERIADHVENIAQDVFYMIQGDIIRHKHLN